MDPDPDAATRSTDSDAAQARLSAVNKGYLVDDPYISYFVPRARFLPPRPPLINVGTFVRATAIDELVYKWIDSNDQVQIVSLGAGSDTRFWRLSASARASKVVHYLEVDFGENTARKAAVIRKTPALNGRLKGPLQTEKGGTALRSANYTLFPCDLRDPPSSTLGQFVADGTLKTSVPTLFISECVFAYMPQAASDAVVQWFGGTFDVAGGVLYEMFGLTDSFGDMMRRNLMSRAVTLPGVDAYPTLETQRSRYLNQEYSDATALSLKSIRRSYMALEEMSRISTLEMLDEIEELELVLDHYVIAWGVKASAEHTDKLAQLRDWRLVQQRQSPSHDES